MLESLVIGSSATGIMVYLMSKVRCYFTSCHNPTLIIDSNDNELTTVTNRNDTEVLIISKYPKEYCLC